jgi:tRNA (guanine10-N2)-dimethyltransferase
VDAGDNKRLIHCFIVKYLLRLSREHESLPIAELRATLEGEGIDYDITCLDDFLLLDCAGDDPSFMSRLAYTLHAWELMGSSDCLDLLSGMVFDNICDIESFRIRSAERGVESRIGDFISGLGVKVDLKNPAADVLVRKTGKNYCAWLKMDLCRDYELRKPQYRRFFHPISMHPKLARAMVNLARVSPGMRVFDPFCGTGGILIEAGLMGLKPIGLDLDEGMVRGCRQNLSQYGIVGDVRAGDALSECVRADAIVTDPPYGRSSNPGMDPARLYGDFIGNARAMLDEGRILSMMLPSDIQLEFGGFDIAASFDVRMHRSLTRRLWVLRAI